MYPTSRQTFFPAGSSVCEEDSEQQSRAPRALRRSFISTLTQKPKPGTKYLSVSRLCVQSFPPPSSQIVLRPVRGRTMGGSISLSVCPPPFPPSFPSCESSCGSSAAREVEAPRFPLPISWGSQSHFLLFSQTQSFLKTVEH